MPHEWLDLFEPMFLVREGRQAKCAYLSQGCDSSVRKQDKQWSQNATHLSSYRTDL